MINKCDICGKDFDETKAGCIAVIASHIHNRYKSETIHCCPPCILAFKTIADIIKGKNNESDT